MASRRYLSGEDELEEEEAAEEAGEAEVGEKAEGSRHRSEARQRRASDAIEAKKNGVP